MLASKVLLTHGRLNPRTGGTDIDGHDVDDWGFDGPTLEGCTGLHWTYGEIRLCFLDEAHKNAAQLLTDWADGHCDDDLVPVFVDGCIRTYSCERGRFEFFGDWDITAPSVIVCSDPAVEAADASGFSGWARRIR
jgi:hypothetical protein